MTDIPSTLMSNSPTTCRQVLPYTRLHTVGNTAFLIAAPKVWNSFPDNIVSSASLSTFCHLLKTFLFSVSFSDLIQ